MITKREVRMDDYDEGYSHGFIDGYTKAGLDHAKERETMLDKLRAEIEQMDFDFGDFYDHTDSIVEKVLQIIDKCKVEGEE